MSNTTSPSSIAAMNHGDTAATLDPLEAEVLAAEKNKKPGSRIVFSEEDYAKRDVKSAKAQLKRMLSETWLRVMLIIGIIAAIIFTVILFRALSSEPILQGAGVKPSNTITYNDKLTGRDRLNPAQAEYLMELQRTDAEAKSVSGETNAAVIELPRASLQSVDPNATSDATAFAIEQNGYNFRKQDSDVEKEPINFSTYQSLERNGATVLNTTNNQVTVVPNGNPMPSGMRPATASTAPSPSVPAQVAPPSNATLNTQYSGGGNGGGQYNGGNGGGQYNGGSSSGSAGVDDPQYERVPDPDLPIIQQRLFDSYNSQMQEQEQQAMQIEQLRQQNIAQAQQLEAQRRQMAQQAILEQTQKQRANQGSSFSNRSYKQSQNTENGGAVNLGSSNGQTSNSVNMGTFGQNVNGYNPGDFVRSSYDNQATTSYYGQQSQQSQSSKPPKLLDRNIIRAGTSWPVLITSEVNSDEGLNVIGQVVGGPFNSYTVYGTIVQSGRSIGVSFNRLIPPNPRKQILPLNALAMTIGTQKQAVETSVKNHYLQNYSVIALESVIGGYGAAYANQNETTIERTDGTVITSKGETTKEEVTGNILSRFSDRLSNDVTKLGDRAPTFFIKQGTVLNMVLLSNFDVNSTTDDLGLIQGVGNARSAL